MQTQDYWYSISFVKEYIWTLSLHRCNYVEYIHFLPYAILSSSSSFLSCRQRRSWCLSETGRYEDIVLSDVLKAREGLRIEDVNKYVYIMYLFYLFKGTATLFWVQLTIHKRGVVNCCRSVVHEAESQDSPNREKWYCMDQKLVVWNKLTFVL